MGSTATAENIGKAPAAQEIVCLRVLPLVYAEKGEEQNTYRIREAFSRQALVGNERDLTTTAV